MASGVADFAGRKISRSNSLGGGGRGEGLFVIRLLYVCMYVDCLGSRFSRGDSMYMDIVFCQMSEGATELASRRVLGSLGACRHYYCRVSETVGCGFLFGQYHPAQRCKPSLPCICCQGFVSFAPTFRCFLYLSLLFFVRYLLL